MYQNTIIISDISWEYNICYITTPHTTLESLLPPLPLGGAPCQINMISTHDRAYNAGWKVTVNHLSCLFSKEENFNDAQHLINMFYNTWENLLQVQEEAEIRTSDRRWVLGECGGGAKRPMLSWIAINYRLCIMKNKKRKIQCIPRVGWPLAIWPLSSINSTLTAYLLTKSRNTVMKVFLLILKLLNN